MVPIREDNTLLEINLQTTALMKMTITKYSILDAFSRVGSIFTAIKGIGTILVAILNTKAMFDYELIRNLFTFEDNLFNQNERKVSHEVD